jgi:hypothetical protein
VLIIPRFRVSRLMWPLQQSGQKRRIRPTGKCWSDEYGKEKRDEAKNRI